MAELVDALASGASESDLVGVQISLSAQFKTPTRAIKVDLPVVDF